MKSYFLKLFNYDQFANKAILKSIIQVGEPEQAVKLMAHLLAAQQIWLNRCKGLHATGIVLWPDQKANTFEKIIDENHKAWMDFLDGLKVEDFKKIIAYKNSKGDSYENLTEDILAHLINHGTHHRAQIGQQLKLAGIESLPNTDYIFYMR
ncbi:DinB family protein [Mucilaginibacter sp.]